MSDWKYFTENELRCRGTGDCHMDKSFMKKLNRLREDYGKPMIISSGYRDVSYNTVTGGSPDSAHTYGKAVDVVVVEVAIVNMDMEQRNLYILLMLW